MQLGFKRIVVVEPVVPKENHVLFFQNLGEANAVEDPHPILYIVQQINCHFLCCDLSSVFIEYLWPIVSYN